MDIRTEDIPAYTDGLPIICGSEDMVAEAMSQPGPFYLPDSGVVFGDILLALWWSMRPMLRP